MRSFVSRHPLLTYFFVAFGVAWAILIPSVLASYGLITLPATGALLVVMGYGPTIAAILVALLKRLIIWRVGWRWWAIALLLNGSVILLALALYGASGNDAPAFPALTPTLLWEVPLVFVLVGLLNGEEIGWRGFALPHMLAQFGMPRTVLLLGMVEGLFHLPIFFNNGASAAGGQNGTPFGAFLVSSILAVYVIAWVYQHTRGSVLIATMVHASMNAWSNILPFPATSASFFWMLALAQLVVVGVILIGTHACSPTPTRRLQEALVQ